MNSLLYNSNSCSSFPLQKIRCAIYTRKSCEEGLELEYNSLENQYDVCLNYIKAHESDGWFLINKRYDDGGFSGGNLDRPALKELINDVNLDMIDKIIIYKLDRISRNKMDYYRLADFLQKKKIDIEIATQDFDRSTSIGRFSFDIMLNFAQLEREMTSDRIKEKIRQQQSMGMWTGGTVPIGYDVVDKKLLINNSESKIVKTIFNTFIETKSIDETINILNDLGYKTKVYRSKNDNNVIIRGGVNFNRGSLYHILNNKLYIGKIENKVINKVFDGIHEAIIDEETFNKVQEIFKTNLNIKKYNRAITNSNSCNASINTIKNYYPKKDSKMPYLLRGLMKCSCCNSILTPVFTTKKKSGLVYRYYRSNKAIKRSACCGVGNIPADNIENIILNQIYSILRSPTIVSGIIDKLKNDSLDCFNYNSNYNSINSSIISSLNFKENDIIKYLKNIEVVWDELFPKEQVKIVRTIIKQIFVSEDNVKIIFNNNGILKLLADAGQLDIGLINRINNINNINTNINNNSSNNLNSNLNYEVNIPVNFRRKAGRSFITTPDGKDVSFVQVESRRSSSQNEYDNNLIFNLIQAETWMDELTRKKDINISSIASREDKEVSYICKVLNLVFLAPDIKKAILSNNIKLGLTLLDLYGCKNLDWASQRRKLGIIGY